MYECVYIYIYINTSTTYIYIYIYELLGPEDRHGVAVAGLAGVLDDAVV